MSAFAAAMDAEMRAAYGDIFRDQLRSTSVSFGCLWEQAQRDRAERHAAWEALSDADKRAVAAWAHACQVERYDIEIADRFRRAMHLMATGDDPDYEGEW